MKLEIPYSSVAVVGLYQLSAMRIPAHAAVSATVEAAGKLRQRSARGLINALLRRFQREGEALLAPLGEPAAAALPDWLWEAFHTQWSTQLAQIVDASNGHPPMTLRVNRLRGDRDAYLAELASLEITARAGRLSEDSVILERPMDVMLIPGFTDGRVSVQDEAAQLAAQLINPRPGARILDACAAPGGKTGHLLERLGAEGQVLAADISEERLARVGDNLSRLGLDGKLLCTDVGNPSSQLREAAPFDAILLDVPCSASGVIRRHPDIKLLRRASDIAGFARRQAALLAASWSLLGEGGQLLYVTCSILGEENQAVVGAFMETQADAQETPLAIPAAYPCSPGWQLLPDPAGGDGLYFALLRKTSAARKLA